MRFFTRTGRCFSIKSSDGFTSNPFRICIVSFEHDSKLEILKDRLVDFESKVSKVSIVLNVIISIVAQLYHVQLHLLKHFYFLKVDSKRNSESHKCVTYWTRSHPYRRGLLAISRAPRSWNRWDCTLRECVPSIFNSIARAMEVVQTVVRKLFSILKSVTLNHVPRR